MLITRDLPMYKENSGFNIEMHSGGKMPVCCISSNTVKCLFLTTWKTSTVLDKLNSRIIKVKTDI